VTDNDDLTATASQLVQVEEPPQTNEPPQAAITGPTSGLTDEPLDFSGSNSSDSDGNIVSYIWDFGDGETAAGADVTHTYAASGTYGLQLTVTDDDGSADTASQTIRVEDPVNYPPTAVITGPVSGVVGEPLTFSGSASNDSDGNIVSYSWDFGDGVLGTGVVVSHTYTITGSYVITLTVTDDDDLINSAGYPVQINPAGQAPP
jgi:PKD repeat protein